MGRRRLAADGPAETGSHGIARCKAPCVTGNGVAALLSLLLAATACSDAPPGLYDPNIEALEFESLPPDVQAEHSADARAKLEDAFEEALQPSP